MKTSQRGIALIKEFEGLRLSAYPDPGSGNEPWTIGIGTTVYPDGRKVKRGDKITEDEALDFLRVDLAKFEAEVNRLVKVKLNQNQFDALVSLVYNIGAGAFAKSTLLRRLNAGDYKAAEDEFARWNRAGVNIMPGLVRRRSAEAHLFGAKDSVTTPIPEPVTPFPEPVAPIPVSPPVFPPADPVTAPVSERKSFMAPVLALLPSLIALVPELAKLFGNQGPKTERNIAAITKVAELAVTATGATNLQEAVEKAQSDANARQAISNAVQSNWFEIVEVAGGIATAREFNLKAALVPAWRMPAVWISVALLALVFMVVGSVLWGNGWSNEIRLQVVTAVLTVIGIVSSFWIGSSAGSRDKDDAMIKNLEK
jgi:lysozyme